MNYLAQYKRPSLDMFSCKEREVIQYTSCGLSRKQIAAAMGISDNTVRSHLTSIYRKSGLYSMTQLAVWALTGFSPDSVDNP